MSEPRRTLPRAAVLLALMVGAPTAHADATRSLDESAMVGLLAAQSPTLRSALLARQLARETESGLEAQYAATVVLDASAQQTATPQLFRSGIVSMTKVRRADTGAELRKHLVWGTDLTLRLAGNIQQSEISGGFFSVGGLPTTASTSSTFKFGPGYGVLGKLSLKQPLIRGRGRSVGEADLRAARLESVSKDKSHARIASEALRDALSAYWELWYAQEVVHVEEEALRVAAAERDDADARVRTGSLAPADALAFETALASREESLLTARTSLATQQLTLAQTLGTVDQPDGARFEVATPAERYVFSAVVAEQRALESAPELDERETALELARVQAKTSADPERHRLDLEAWAQLQGLGNKSVSDATTMFIQGDAVSAFVGLSYEAPVTDRRMRAAAAKARLTVASAEEDLRAARQRVLTEVRTALDAFDAGERKVELATRTASIAERQRDAERARYASGSSTSVAVLKAEEDLRAAQQRVLRARADAAESAFKLEHLTGKLLERYAGVVGR
jgi:outer membrane protein